MRLHAVPAPVSPFLQNLPTKEASWEQFKKNTDFKDQLGEVFSDVKKVWETIWFWNPWATFDPLSCERLVEQLYQEGININTLLEICSLSPQSFYFEQFQKGVEQLAEKDADFLG